MTKTKFKETEIGKIPEDWEVANVGNFVKIKHGYAFKGQYFTDVPNDNVILTPGNFNIGGGFKKDKFKYTTEEYPTEYVLSEGDIIVSMTDLSKKGDTLGYSAKVPQVKVKKYLHNQRLGLLRFLNNKVEKDFLYWVLRTKYYNQTIVGSASGSTVKHTSPSRIKQYSFALPLFNEQKAIAKILSDLDSKIELNQQMNKTLEAVGHALFKRWFVDFEFPNDEGKPYKSSGGEMADAELGKIPKGWRSGTLKEIIEITSGKRPSDKSDIKKDEFNIPLIGASSIMGYVRESLYSEPILIIGRVGTHGVVQRVSYPSFPSDNTLVIKSRYYNFVFHSLKRLDYNSLNVGTTQPLITQSGIKQTKIIIPQNDILSKFEKTLMAVYESIDRNLSENENLSQIRDSLLPRLMSGRIKAK